MEDFLIDVPQSVRRKDDIFGIDFHPKRNLVAFGTISGTVQVQQYEPNASCKSLFEHNHHKNSCRSVIFSSNEGENMFSSSSDKSIVGINVETQSIIFERKKAHESGINAMTLKDHLVITGDEDGVIKMWDQRSNDKVKSIEVNVDYISSFAIHPDRNCLLATSGDQSLTVIDYGSGKLIEQSEEQDDELLCLSVIKGGRKVVCGGSSGLLSVFTFDQWADRSSIYPGHPDSIDCMVQVDDSTIITGCGDGLIRIVSLLPNKIIGVISAQSEELPISSMSISHDKKYLAACIDNTVQFFNVSMLFDDDGEPEPAQEDEDQVVVDGGNSDSDNEKSNNEEEFGGDEIAEDGEVDFEADMAPSSSSLSSSESSGDEESARNGGDEEDKTKRKKDGKSNWLPKAKNTFFDDL